eukprot:11673941-Alexandrium_andersonii.AAC.1
MAMARATPATNLPATTPLMYTSSATRLQMLVLQATLDQVAPHEGIQALKDVFEDTSECAVAFADATKDGSG